ncbi:MAG TPA: tripartite tricarboxylate transporter substrate-binding protein [Acetobacteraceae bacterium]|nr:tripartite tricarboxylate transporter substrate-binding protein [Acetobacteraceae bacterium]
MRRALFLVLVLLATPAGAQEWRIVNGFAPGGTADVLARLLAEHVAPSLGARPVVETRTGANGMIAAEAIARGPADGSAVMVCVMGMLAIAPEMPGARLPLDPGRELRGVSTVALSPYALVVAAHGPHRDLAGLLAAARAPQGITYASVGPGSAPHLAGELLRQRAGGTMAHVPYRGAAPAILDIVAGRTDFLFISLGDITRQVRAGELRLLALGDESGRAVFPDAPVIGSLVPGVAANTWFGLCGARAMPDAAAERWAAAVRVALSDSALLRRLEEMGLTPHPEGPAEMDARAAADRRRWGEVIRAGGVRAE